MERLKRICLSVLCVAVLFGLFGVVTSAEDIPDSCSLDIVYAGDGIPFSGLQIEIYRMGELNEDGVYTLADDFASYPVDISYVTTQAEWHVIADTLAAFALTDGLTPTATCLTNESGEAVFDELDLGMYLVLAERYQNGKTVYLFENFLVALPGVDQDGLPQYDVRAIPKHDQYTPSPEDISFKVVKQWKGDDGINRPDSVTVDIYKDSELQFRQQLSSENNWSYEWTAADDGAVWSVKETSVPDGYSVTMDQNGETFIITNSWSTTSNPDESDDPSNPSTGETRVLWPYVMLLFFSGATLALVASRGRKA